MTTGIAWETYNGYIKTRRDEGATLQNIAEEIGRTRERVRQILVEHYGTADVEGEVLTTKQLIELTNYSGTTLYKLYRKGIITKIGKGRLGIGRWPLETLNIILEYRRCKICDKPLGKGKGVYCSEACRVEAGKYKNRPEAQKKAQVERTQCWQKAHPERYREICNQATKRYLLKQKCYLYQRFDLIIPILIKEEEMERYPYQATIIQKEAIPKGPVPRGAYALLLDLKNQLQPGQAIQLIVPDKKKAEAIGTAWRRMGKSAGLQPHRYTKKQKDGTYFVYLWLD